MMLVSYVLIFICVSILPTATSHLNFIDWQCGSEDLSRQVAYESVMDHCPEFAPQMNHCCAVHDDCYTHQLGQKKCDADFCECSLRVTNESKAGACKPIVDISCELMDWVGWYAYANSVNYTEPAGIKKYTLNVDVLEQQFEKLYGECPRVNSTMSSCALMFNLCSDSSEKCARSVCSCMYEAYKVDKSERCGVATHEMCEAVKRGRACRDVHSYVAMFCYSSMAKRFSEQERCKIHGCCLRKHDCVYRFKQVTYPYNIPDPGFHSILTIRLHPRFIDTLKIF